MLFVIHGHFDLIKISQAEHMSPIIIYQPISREPAPRGQGLGKRHSENSKQCSELYLLLSFIHSFEGKSKKTASSSFTVS